MFPAASDTACKRVLKDRILYTFPLAILPNETRRSALVIVWHGYGEIVTCFVPDIGIVQNNGEVRE